MQVPFASGYIFEVEDEVKRNDRGMGVSLDPEGNHVSYFNLKKVIRNHN